MEISRLLLTNYLPYAKSTIIARAIPSIDGCKPVQRRVLYSMLKMGLLNGDKAKSQRIIGQTMALHPHGEGSIYECMVLMSSGYDGLNIPYVESKGSFGKIYSRELKYSAPRYTEAKLAKICNEMFDGIDKNAVDFIPNFDSTETEPTLLPVKFPSIIVNTSSGVAVGTSSNIPSFSLKNVCLATQGILTDKINTPRELAEVLGAPEFTTGGFVHCDINSLEKLCATGKGTFSISGQVDIYSDKIIVNEIPYCTTAEDIMDTIEENVKENKLKGVSEVRDEIGLNGLRLVIEIKRGYNSRAVLREICRLTPIRTKISFRTRIILEDRCKELSLLEVLESWINFRQTCIERVNQFKLDKDTDKEHLLSTWEKIKDHIKEVVLMISSNTDANAKKLLMNDYKLDETQAEYLLDMRIRSITVDAANKALSDLETTKENIKIYTEIVSSDSVRKNIIFKELEYIINKYGINNKTISAPELTEDDIKQPDIKISDEDVTIVYTTDGYIKRLVSLNDIMRAKSSGDVAISWSMKNNQHLLVFDRFGCVHKILADDIDSGRGAYKDKLYIKAGLEKQEDIIWADACGDYSGYFNLVLPRGSGLRVMYDRAKGKREQYKGLYAEVKCGQYWITQENKFFMITRRLKAAFCDITKLGTVIPRSAFKIASISSGDSILKLVEYKNIPNTKLLDLERYSKDYTVSLGNDILWIDVALANKEKQLEKGK